MAYHFATFSYSPHSCGNTLLPQVGAKASRGRMVGAAPPRFSSWLHSCPTARCQRAYQPGRLWLCWLRPATLFPAAGLLEEGELTLGLLLKAPISGWRLQGQQPGLLWEDVLFQGYPAILIPAGIKIGIQAPTAAPGQQ